MSKTKNQTLLDELAKMRGAVSPASASSAVQEPVEVVVETSVKHSSRQETPSKHSTGLSKRVVDIGSTHISEAERLVRKYMYCSAGVGLIPIPMVDFAGMIAVQLKMLREMSELYGVPFCQQRSKSIVASLIGTMGAGSLSSLVFFSFVKWIPVVGALGGGIAVPIITSASTYAVGRVFITHFESGGTFLNFDLQKTRSHFATEFEKGRVLAAEKR